MVTSLAFTFLGLAGLYVLLGAEFVAFVQVLDICGSCDDPDDFRHHADAS